MMIREHFLEGPEVIRIPCRKTDRLMEATDKIILHATNGSDTMSSALYLAKSATPESAHLVITRSGQVIQLLPFNAQAAHTGPFIIIALDNAGRLFRRGYRYFSRSNKEYSPSEVYTTVENGRAAYWHRYTETQMDKLIEICQILRFATNDEIHK